MSPRFTHTNCYTDVHIIRRASPDSELFKPKVDVGPKGGNHVAFIAASLTFEDEKNPRKRAALN